MNVWYKAGSWGQTSAYIAWIPSLGVGAYAMSNSGSTTGPKNVVNSVLKSYTP